MEKKAESSEQRAKRVAALVGFWSKPENLRVERGWLTDGNGSMKASCHHKKGNAYGYCGGCAARLDRVLDVVEAQLREGLVGDALLVIEASSAARKSDKR